MNSSTKLQHIRNAFTTITTHDNTERIVLRDESEITPEIRTHLLDVLRNVSENVGDFELAYDIVSRATNELPRTLKELDDLDPYNIEYASVYTRDRLDYLTIHNQEEITELVHESTDRDIATACAIWYDNNTSLVLQDLIDFIKQ